MDTQNEFRVDSLHAPLAPLNADGAAGALFGDECGHVFREGILVHVEVDTCVSNPSHHHTAVHWFMTLEGRGE